MTGGQQVFTEIGMYKGVIVAPKHIKKEHLQLTREVLLEFNDVSFCSSLLKFGNFGNLHIHMCLGLNISMATANFFFKFDLVCGSPLWENSQSPTKLV